MPKLAISQRTKGEAVAALLKLYKAEPDFARELAELRTVHKSVLQQLIKIGVPNWIQMKKALTQEEFSLTRDFFLTENQTISDDLYEKLEHLFSMPPHFAKELDAYEKVLTDLACRWGLKATWAGPVLLMDHILGVAINAMPEDIRNAELPVEVAEPFLPSAPLPPLSFHVNPYELMYSGRTEIQNKFAKALAGYEDELKTLGWRELPSSLERHAYWSPASAIASGGCVSGGRLPCYSPPPAATVAPSTSLWAGLKRSN